MGAGIRDHRNRVFALRLLPRLPTLPASWDIVAGQRESGETPEEALARQVGGQTGWRLRHVEAVISDWECERDAVVCHEIDYSTR